MAKRNEDVVKNLMTMAETERFLGIKRDALRHLMDSGTIGYQKAGQQYLFSRTELINKLENWSVKTD